MDDGKLEGCRDGIMVGTHVGGIDGYLLRCNDGIPVEVEEGQPE